MNLELTMKMTGLFVDRKEVARAIAKSKKRPLVRWGALTRIIARQSIRKRKKSAAAGKPPSSHSPEPNLRTIYFAWDMDTETVPVGPVLLDGRTDPPLPEVIQKGGPVASRRKVRGRYITKKVRRYVKPHPFMGPALEESARKAPNLFEDSIVSPEHATSV